LNSNGISQTQIQFFTKTKSFTKIFLEHESYHDPILSEIRALGAAARAEGDEEGEDDHSVFTAISPRRATSKQGENNWASGIFTIKSEDQEVDVSNAQDQYKSIMMKFEAADIGMETIAFGTNSNFNSSTTWASQLRDTLEIIELGSNVTSSDTTIPYIARVLGDSAISTVIETLGETNALNDVAMDLLCLVKDADEPSGQQRQSDVISISRWSHTIGGIAIVLDILKDAGIIVQTSTDAPQILRQLQLELKRAQSQIKKGKRITANANPHCEPGGEINATVLSALVPTDTSSLIARSTMIETEDFIEGKVKISAKVFLSLQKMSELAPRMIAIAKIDEQDKDTAKALLTVSVGATNNWGETCHYLLASAAVEGSPVCFEDMEILMATLSNLDKFINTFDLLNVPSGGFMKMLESAKKRVHMRVPNRTRNLFLAFSLLIFKASTQNRASMSTGKKLSIPAWEAVIDEHEHDVRLIGEGGLSFRLQPGISICHKWTQKMRKADLFFEKDGEKGSLGCRDFVVRGKCLRGIQCKMVHSDQAKCSYGPSCKFLSSEKGCFFKGPESHAS
jgi:hypothetical protein